MGIQDVLAPPPGRFYLRAPLVCDTSSINTGSLLDSHYSWTALDDYWIHHHICFYTHVRGWLSSFRGVCRDVRVRSCSRGILARSRWCSGLSCIGRPGLGRPRGELAGSVRLGEAADAVLITSSQSSSMADTSMSILEETW